METTEEQLLNDIFGEGREWKGIKIKYKLDWCGMCQTATIVCPSCKNSSCNGGGCSECHDDFNHFNTIKTSVYQYVTQEEWETMEKGRRLEKLILKSLSRNEFEINWGKMNGNGELSDMDRKYFKEFLEKPEKSL